MSAEPLDGDSDCGLVIPEQANDCLCNKTLPCHQNLPKTCFKNRAQNVYCQDIPQECLDADDRIATIHRNLHNPRFHQAMKECLLSKSNALCGPLGKEVKGQYGLLCHVDNFWRFYSLSFSVSMVLVVNNVNLGDNGCILKAGNNFLCLMKIHDTEFYCGLENAFKFWFIKSFPGDWKPVCWPFFPSAIPLSVWPAFQSISLLRQGKISLPARYRRDRSEKKSQLTVKPSRKSTTELMELSLRFLLSRRWAHFRLHPFSVAEWCSENEIIKVYAPGSHFVVNEHFFRGAQKGFLKRSHGMGRDRVPCASSNMS